jgi:general secretion pathway protein D
VFFNRIGKQTSSTVTEIQTRRSEAGSGSEGRLKRRAVALTLAVQVAMPAGLLSRVNVARAATTNGAGKGSSQPSPRDFYDLARASLKIGNLADARRSLIAARAAGFTPSRFEPSIDSLLTQAGGSAAATPAVTPAKPAAPAVRPVLHDGPVRPVALATHPTPAASAPAASAPAASAPAASAPAASAPAASAPAPTIYAMIDPSTNPADATPPTTAGTPGTKAVAVPVPQMPTAEDRNDAAQVLDQQAKLDAIQKHAAAYEAGQLVEKARAEEKASEYSEASNDVARALKIDPGNEQAMALQVDLNQLRGMNAAPRHNSSDEVKLQRTAIQYEFNTAIATATTNINNKKFTDAAQDIERASVFRNQNPTLFAASELTEFDTRIADERVLLETRRQESVKEDAERQVDVTAKADQERAERYKMEQEQQVAALTQTARQYLEEGKYSEGLAILDNIIHLDPTNVYATSIHQIVQDKADLERQKQYRDKFNNEFTKVLIEAEEKKIPYDNTINYSSDWPELSKRRDQEVKEERGDADEDTVLQAKLDTHIADLKYNANSLTDVIENLRDQMGANIYVDWAALERASIARDAPVTARARDIKFSKALELIFKSVEGDDDEHKLGYTLDEGVITISTKKELNKNTSTRRYDINDLLFVAPDYTNAPDLSLQNATQGSGGGGGGGGGGQTNNQSIFNNAQGNQQNQTAAGGTREQRIDEIKSYIVQNVDFPSWKDNGGDTGSISSSPLRAILLITQTPENQHKIVSVLDSLRASQALQVSVECRFLVVQRNYLEDIGVNASFEFNPLQVPGNARSGYNSSRFSPITVSQSAVTDNTTFLDANGNLVANAAQGSRQLDWISNVGNATVPGSIAANPGDYPNPIVIEGSYLDNLTVNFLIRAVQANQNTTTLTAPRLTLFSGQRAVLVVSTQQAYVSDLIPVVATGAALFQPIPATTFASAVVLKVQATVSPDRKYVYLDLQPQLARLRALVPFTVSAVVTPVTTVIGGTTTSSIINGTFQLPTIDVTQVFTSCSVPDGATLLLGGQTLAAETTREQGVPVLSKIPFLKRLFTNRATSQDEQILLILVKPTILIQHETEQRQFPQLSGRSTGT